MKYRIKQRRRVGFYNIYTVQYREWWWPWWGDDRSFNSIEKCQAHIADQSVQEQVYYHEVP